MGSLFDPSAQHDDVDARIVAALERLSQVFRVRLGEEARQRNLSPIQAQLLIYLLHHDVELRRVSQLAREFDLTQATVSDAVASLETKGLVRREQWPDDRRVVTLRLTPEAGFDPSLLSHELEGRLLRALAEFPRVVAAAAELREPHRIARYLEDTASAFHKFYDS